MQTVRSFSSLLAGLLVITPTLAWSQADPLKHTAPLNINTHFIRIHDDATAGAGYDSNSIKHSYPVRGATGIYIDFQLIGGYLVESGNRRLWVSGSNYYSGFSSGTLQENSAPPPDRVYRIRRDYITADLRQDAADSFSKPPEDVTESDVAQLRAQYAADLSNWPVVYGAPLDDRGGVGTPGPHKEPGFLDADMVIWCTTTDDASPSVFACQPVGLETQITWWGYKGHTHALGNSIFVRYLMIFRGLPGMDPASRLDSLYVTKFSEPDLGNPSDDLMGCDTTLQLGYIYNGQSLDSELLSMGIRIPHVLGYDLLDARVFHKTGPIQQLRMSSYFVKPTGTPISEPPWTEEGGRRMYRWMRGYIPDPSSAPLRAWEDAAGNPTFFLFAGDPITGRGDLDGQGTEYSLAPGNRRFLMNVGPFSLGIGDSVELVYAITGAPGGDRIRNIDYLRWLTQYLRQAYPDLASLRQYEDVPPAPPASLPATVALWSNYPNPFNAGTSIKFELPADMSVRLTVYNLLGQEIRTLANATIPAGTHVATWNGTDAMGAVVASGVYFYRFEAGGMTATKRMVYLK